MAPKVLQDKMIDNNFSELLEFNNIENDNSPPKINSNTFSAPTSKNVPETSFNLKFIDESQVTSPCISPALTIRSGQSTNISKYEFNNLIFKNSQKATKMLS